MTAREIADLLDKQATLSVYTTAGRGTEPGPNRLEIPVQILNARENFGRIDVLVTPEGGSGQAWVSAERVKVRG